MKLTINPVNTEKESRAASKSEEYTYYRKKS